MVPLVVDPVSLSDEGWLTLADSVAVGQAIRLTRLHATTFFRLFSLGFWRASRTEWRRIFDWRTPRPFVPCAIPHVPLGGIVVVSVARTRDQQQEPYLYRTLRTLFASMPRGIEVNVFVGSECRLYATPTRLADALGREVAGHVHVIPAKEDEARFLARHATTSERTAWNHTRALRSYQHGDGRLLFLEDDIVWSRYATKLVTAAAFLDQPELLKLYHGYGYDARCTYDHPCQKEDIEIIYGGIEGKDFSCCQALLYNASLARRVANAVSLRFQPYPVDTTIGIAFRNYRTMLGYVRPSAVQHVGRVTAVNRPFHEAPCFVPDDTNMSPM